MKKIISKSRAEGKINLPTSKSMAHRLLIAAALCKGQTSRIYGITPSDDVLATIDCLTAMGVKIELRDDFAEVSGIDFSRADLSRPLNCRESGSTLRFLIPLCLLSGGEATLIGSEKLISRPQSVYEEIATLKKADDRIILSGELKAGEYRVPGNISSQFITGLLFALSTLQGDSRIVITTEIESRSYIDLTIAAMAEFRVRALWEDSSTLLIPGGQTYLAKEVKVEGDWSGAAFIEAFNHLGGRVELLGISESSLQGDRICTEHFRSLERGYCEINIEDCPDLGPILFTMAAIKCGAKFLGTKRLKIKESDRALAMKNELQKFGAELDIEENTVTVLPRELHAPKEVLCGHNDHRIVMSLAVISTLFGGEIDGCEAVKKSYPNFFEDIKTLGIITHDT